MAIIIKKPREIELVRQAGRIVYTVLEQLRTVARPGETTEKLEQLADRVICESGGTALFRGVPHPQGGQPFPACICTSLNEQVVHGIPGPRRLEQGDIISIDCGVRREGYCGDAAITIPVGTVDSATQQLIDVTRQVLQIAVEQVAPGRRWSQIAACMQEYVEQAGFSVVKDFVGHGIGTSMHEDPKIPNFVSPELLWNDFVLEPGMALAIEPMVNAGSSEVHYDSDGWTVVTSDACRSAHFEHTIAVTNTGAEVLTNGD